MKCDVLTIGDNRMSGVERLRADSQLVDHIDQNPTTFPRTGQADTVHREEGRKDQGGREEQATGPVYSGDQLQRPAEGPQCLHHA